VVVTYRPDPAELAVVLRRLASQVSRLLVIDNGSGSNLDLLPGGLPAQATLLRNAENEGLAAAYNRAIAWARARECRFLLLMDQDSLVDEGMVAALADAYTEMAVKAKVAAVGPCFIDAHTGRQAPFVRIGFPLNKKSYCSPGERVECDFLISSGSLIPLDVIDAIGGMDETLFIDNVDLEWCFRARRSGFRLYGIGSARMQHRLGDRMAALPFGLGSVVAHSALRLRYMTRNRILLYGRRATPRTWIAQDIPRLILKFVLHSLFVRPRMSNARAMLSGGFDALRGRVGRIDDPP